jgi:anti-sigma regulatory factor (Ser/Thr protein kinase)
MFQISLDLPNEAESVPLCRRIVRAALRELAVEADRGYAIETVVTEATANVIRHAYDHPGQHYRVVVEFFTNRVRLQVSDHGRGFSRAAVADPEEDQMGGWGLPLIEQLADTASFRTSPDGGCLVEAEFVL